MKLSVFLSISGLWYAVVQYKGRFIETCNTNRNLAVSKALEIAVGYEMAAAIENA